jgi:hypothetical protein
MPDKRSYRRFSLENSIFLKFDQYPGQVIEGKLLDISFSGMSIFLKENIDPICVVQTLVQFDVRTSVEQRLFGRAKVVHIKQSRLYAQTGFRVGLEFIEVDKETVLNILDRLESIIIEQIRRRNQAPRKDPGLF